MNMTTIAAKLGLMLIVLLTSIDSSSQDPFLLTPTIIPPSPSAGELGRYGLIPMGLSTGTMNLEIPLYEFTTRNLKLPISIAYNSSPVRVDEISSWVGMHWSLNSGGVITRMVRDEADDGKYFDIPYPENFSSLNPKAIHYIESAGNGMIDTEPDIYSYNFSGHAGKFVFDRTGEIISIPRNDLIIQRYRDSHAGGFIIITPDGVKYTFSAAEYSTMQTSNDASFPSAVSAWYLTKIEHPVGDAITLSYENHSYSYYLGASQTLARSTTRNFCGPGNEGHDQKYMVYCAEQTANNSVSSIFLAGKRLTKIESVGYGTVNFNSSLTRSDVSDYKLDGFVVKDTHGSVVKQFEMQYLFSNNNSFTNSYNESHEDMKHRMFLNKLIEKDKGGNNVKKHQFEYADIDGLPARLSFAQDHWGYFNGAANSTFLPKNKVERDYTGALAFAGFGGDREMHADFVKMGSLIKITYPTGGNSNFSYEANTYYGQKLIYPSITPVSLHCTGREGPLPLTKSLTVISPVDQLVDVYANTTLIQGYQFTEEGARVTVVDANGTTVAGQDILIDVPYSVNIQLLANHQYTFTITAKNQSDGVNNTVTSLFFDYYATAPQIVNDNLETGGLRVRAITNYDPVTRKSENISYHYARYDQLTHSSGKASFLPDYVTRYFVRNSCHVPCEYYDCPYVALHSNNVSNQFLTSNNIYYEFVTIKKGTNSGAGLEEHEFSISFDNVGVQVWGSDYIKDAPLSNTSWNNNQEKYVRYFSVRNGNPVLIRQTYNSYVKDSRYHKEVSGLTVRKKFEPACRNDAVVTCDLTNTSLSWDVYMCIANHNHLYLNTNADPRSVDLAPYIKCTAPGARMGWATYLRHPCSGQRLGATVIVSTNLFYVDALEYKNISEWVYLEKIVETIWDENGMNPQISQTEYYYDNPTHMKLSRIRSTTSEGKQTEVTMRYAYDYAPEAGEAIAAFHKKGIFGVPIKKETTLDGNQIGGELINYNVRSQPTNVYRYESATLMPPAAHDPNRLIPSSLYKAKSDVIFDALTTNPLKIQLTNNFSTVYLWGYGDTLPIAEVKNADMGPATDDFNVNDVLLADVTASSPETSLGAPFQIPFSQTVSPSFFVSVLGHVPPAEPLLAILLRKSDGTVITTFYPAEWSLNNMESITLEPGVYQWSYYTGDVLFNSNYIGFNIRLNNNYVGRRTSYKLFHTSFEDDGQMDEYAHTGRKVWQGSYTITTPATNGNYKLSYWQKDVNGPWTLNEQEITITNGASQHLTLGTSGSLIDEVRLHPKDAQMTTYTYDRLVGVTSSTDPGNVTTYFQYDDSGRLSHTYDAKGNLVKALGYHYKGQ